MAATVSGEVILHLISGSCQVLCTIPASIR